MKDFLLANFLRTNLLRAESLDCLDVVEELLRFEKFELWETSGCGNPNGHHYGDFGLAIHTEEVIKLCLEVAETMGGVDRRKVFLSALFHDVGKSFDYEKVNGVWGGNSHRRNIHHISRSCWEFREAAKGLMDEKDIDEISHNILSHHGCREWGSPVAPNTPEAIVLHYCDSISARLFDMKNGEDSMTRK